MKDDRVYFLHILDAIEKILKYTHSGKDVFLSDTMVHDAVVRNLEIIGEALRNVSKKFTASHPDVPWNKMMGMRNKLIHEYFGVDLEIVWRVVERELPDFKKRVESILQEPEKS